MAYAWDLETNTRQSKVFSVPHRRDTKKGSFPLTDSRDIYEMVANQASRRVRSCILAVIPNDVVEMAVNQCEVTLKSSAAGKALEDRIAEMVERFAEYGVTPDQLRAYVGKNVEAFTENDVIRLGKVYRSLKDGIVGSDYFLERMKENPKPRADEIPQIAQESERGQVSLNDL